MLPVVSLFFCYFPFQSASGLFLFQTRRKAREKAIVFNVILYRGAPLENGIDHITRNRIKKLANTMMK